MMQRWQINAGFTMIELMIVVVIISIVTAMAAPSMRSQIAAMKIQDSANTLDALLKQARSDALIYRTNVQVSFSGNTITLSQAGNANYPQSKTLDSNITLDGGSDLTFKPTKTVDNAPITIGACYTGVSTAKYVVAVDAISNITQNKNGTCS